MAPVKTERPAALAGNREATSKDQRSLCSMERGASESLALRPGRPAEPTPGGERIDFAAINRAALAAFPAVLARLLPKGKRIGAEIVALNPRRADRHLGSFRINRYNGRWADFATGDRGGDPISLVAFIANVSQGEAARLLARMLGIEAGGSRHD
jgi:hypothetical protein